MEITSTIEGGVAVLSIAGRIDFATSGTVEQAVATAIGQGGRRVIFDLRDVAYVSSAGLRAILVAAKQAKTAGGGVAIYGLQPDVRDVFTTSGFGRIVPIVADDAQARATLSASE